MKKLFILSIFLASAALAQTTTVTVTITVPASAGPVVTAWLATQCAAYQPNGTTCATFTYPTIQAYIKSVVTPPINAAIAQAVNWAIAANAPSLPSSLSTAVTSLTAAQVTITTGTAAAVPTIAVQ